MPSAAASGSSHAPATGSASLPLERRAGLARQTVALIQDLAAALLADAETARRRCERAGNPTPMAPEIEALVEQAQLLRSQSEKLTRAFAVLDRLIPPAPDEHAAGNGGWRPEKRVADDREHVKDFVAGSAPASPPSYSEDVVPLRPQEREPAPPPAARTPPPVPEQAPSAGQEETREAASAFAVALKLEGVSQAEVESRLVREFGRPDASQIAAEAFGGRRA